MLYFCDINKSQYFIVFTSFNENPETSREQVINIKNTFKWIGGSETQTDFSSRECANTKVGTVLTAGITALANPATLFLASYTADHQLALYCLTQ